MGHLAREFFEALTDLDGRFWRSIGTLLFRPGVLSRDYIAGRRARWMSPVSLFLLANVLYFFAPALTDFDLPLRDHVRGALLLEVDPATQRLSPQQRETVQRKDGQFHSPLTEPWVRARLDALQRKSPDVPALETLEQRYALASANVSKALIVLHVPFLALLLMLGMAGSRHYFAEHFVVALHYFAFALLLTELVVLPGAWIASWFGMQGMPAVAKWLLALLVCGYGALAVRRAYAAAWWRALLLGPALLMGLIAVNVSVYRALQFVIVMALA